MKDHPTKAGTTNQPDAFLHKTQKQALMINKSNKTSPYHEEKYHLLTINLLVTVYKYISKPSWRSREKWAFPSILSPCNTSEFFAKVNCLPSSRSKSRQT